MKIIAFLGGLSLIVVLGAGCSASTPESQRPTLPIQSELLDKREKNMGVIPNNDGTRAALLIADLDEHGLVTGGIHEFKVIEWTGQTWEVIDSESIEGDVNHQYYSNFSWTVGTEANPERINFDFVTVDEGSYRPMPYQKEVGKPAVLNTMP
jgi:hypothetical protein